MMGPAWLGIQVYIYLELLGSKLCISFDSEPEYTSLSKATCERKWTRTYRVTITYRLCLNL